MYRGMEGIAKIISIPLYLKTSIPLKGELMSKKEKIIAICFTISMLLLITSAFVTILTNKPEGYSFNIEKIYHKFIK